MPENPAKAPWYFLGLQELVSFSAFMGGIGIPAIVLIGSGPDPVLSTARRRGTGEWFGGPGGWPLVRRSIVLGLGSTLLVEALAIRFGWLREWFPRIPQLVITALNPGTILTTIYALYSLWLVASINRPGPGAGPVHLFPLRVPGADDHRHLLPRAELGLLLVAGRLAQALTP